VVVVVRVKGDAHIAIVNQANDQRDIRVLWKRRQKRATRENSENISR